MVAGGSKGAKKAAKTKAGNGIQRPSKAQVKAARKAVPKLAAKAG